MQHIAPQLSVDDVKASLAGLGYYEHKRADGFISFKRPLSPRRKYPRFHIYLTPYKDGTHIAIHLDQYHPKGKSNRDQEWCYRGPLVEEELRQIVRSLRPAAAGSKKTRGFFDLLIGK